MNIYQKIALFVGGALFGSAGIKLLSSKDAKKSLYPRHGSSTARQGIRNGYRYFGSGECGGHSGRS